MYKSQIAYFTKCKLFPNFEFEMDRHAGYRAAWIQQTVLFVLMCLFYSFNLAPLYAHCAMPVVLFYLLNTFCGSDLIQFILIFASHFIFQYLSFVQQLLTILSHSLFFVTNTLLYKFCLLISSLHTLINIIFYASPCKIW